MIMLASERNIEQVLLEFKEYASEVDVDFVRRSVRAVGRCAIKLERAAERCKCASRFNPNTCEPCGTGGHYCYQRHLP